MAEQATKKADAKPVRKGDEASAVHDMAREIYLRRIVGNGAASKTLEAIADESFRAAQAFQDYLSQRSQAAIE